MSFTVPIAVIIAFSLGLGISYKFHMTHFVAEEKNMEIEGHS